jgi:hypothetical protein
LVLSSLRRLTKKAAHRAATPRIRDLFITSPVGVSGTGIEPEREHDQAQGCLIPMLIRENGSTQGALTERFDFNRPRFQGFP